RMYNICYVGSGKPNAKQLKALRERVNYNRNRFNISTSNVKGHREYQGQSTQCPKLDMSEFRKSLTNTSSKHSKPSTSKPSKRKADYDTQSIVTFLQSIGQPFSYNFRKKLANIYGVGGGNYTGTMPQNVELLSRVKKDYRANGKIKTKASSKNNKRYP